MREQDSKVTCAAGHFKLVRTKCSTIKQKFSSVKKANHGLRASRTAHPISSSKLLAVRDYFNTECKYHAATEQHIYCSDRVRFFRTFTLQTNASSSHDGGPQLTLLDKRHGCTAPVLCLCRKFVRQRHSWCEEF